MSNKLLIIVGLVLAGILAGGMILYGTNNSKCQANLSAGEISAKNAGQQVIDFINNNILKGQSTASLKDAVEENGLYKIVFDVQGQEVNWRVTKDGKFVFPQVIDLTQAQEPAQEEGTTLGNFSISTDEVCLENGKPIVYFFGSASCPHCQWEKPIAEQVADKFEGLISFHENIDSENDMDIFNKYSTGGVPTLVLGCKYFRVGSGESEGDKTEADNLTALICKLTNGQPGDVCGPVQSLIDQIQ